ncbi:ribbon-helix-helix domain-containing protein [Caldinitratiruptor microaerophilus]|uniref:Ribbon-helix-helix protein CopG domain-containing protein n=1 Tax=Caldinitratiruptor microaerophilus TaxID=671077 RepID=A0AA35G7V0_9FIRM|nr:CopG family transcriptional regulator [Caldinitratiruptor microaerophilus]BDG60441.1 hypothetical protein caldi_15310 [Caldinitratiruptor microaerophilus]
MVRTQIQLTEEQAARLRRLAAHRGVSMAEIVREAVERYMQQAGAADEGELDARALAVIGRFASGQRNVSVEHDLHLDEAFSS